MEGERGASFLCFVDGLLHFTWQQNLSWFHENDGRALGTLLFMAAACLGSPWQHEPHVLRQMCFLTRCA